MWDLWRRHKRKVYVTLGVLGSGYFLYKLYDAHKRRISDLETEFARQRENEELIKAQLQAHFDNIQKIADSATLPHVMQQLSIRVADELDLAPLTERLMKGKGQPNALTAAEKLDLWDRLKILSFTRMVLSLWSMTILNLFIRVQVNILGRHLYIDTARGLGNSDLIEEADLIDRDDEQQFLAIADFLSNYEVPALAAIVEAATSEVLKGKQLKDFFSSSVLHDTIVQILDTFMSTRNPHQWLRYLIPDDPRMYKFLKTPEIDSEDHSRVSKFEQLTDETRAVLSSAEFGNILDVSLRVLVDAVVEEIDIQSGIPLAKLIPRIAQMGQNMLEEPSRQRKDQI
ncbi:OLC1v1014111C3 [Oldenlandia corymbosa var. corymbosa]|uniref:OLC1v1014111C3 n=2 Tax=Oldenlandia corymbosa var. corymbosa TaxID=529605 RepID=A0AAV1E2G4_OLDCO|nr:OLC1v1014111C3 [Oldenlandia corymbosa var. corymbosa]